jgi:hypothetical protein
MSIFGDIWHKITGSAHAEIPTATTDPASPKESAPDAVSAAAATTTGSPTTPVTTMSEVDVEVILVKLISRPKRVATAIGARRLSIC